MTTDTYLLTITSATGHTWVEEYPTWQACDDRMAQLEDCSAIASHDDGTVVDRW